MQQAAAPWLSSDDIFFFSFLFHCALDNEAEKGLFIFITSLCNCVLGFLLNLDNQTHRAPLRKDMLTFDKSNFTAES